MKLNKRQIAALQDIDEQTFSANIPYITGSKTQAGHSGIAFSKFKTGRLKSQIMETLLTFGVVTVTGYSSDTLTLCITHLGHETVNADYSKNRLKEDTTKAKISELESANKTLKARQRHAASSDEEILDSYLMKRNTAGFMNSYDNTTVAEARKKMGYD
jgi:hypothetical protein